MAGLFPCTQTKEAWYHCNHVYRDVSYEECDGYPNCECKDRPLLQWYQSSNQVGQGHRETLPDGTVTELCEECRKDQKERKVTDDDSQPVDESQKKPGAVYKAIDPKNIEKLR